MSAQTNKEKLALFYRDLCIGFVGSLRALSLYPADHPETKKKISNIFQRLSKYLSQKPALTLLIAGGDIVLENIPLLELSKTLAQFIQRMEDMKIQRIVFQKGLSSDELVFFLQLLLPLMKKPDDALETVAKNQGRLPHILAGALPTEVGPQISYEDLSGVLKDARQSVLSFSEKLKDLFTDIQGPLSGTKVAMAKETTETIHRMSISGEIPLKVIIHRRGTDADPYIHALNVCALSMSIAQEIELEESIIQEVGLGALLHDIGLHLPSPDNFSETAAITLSERDRQWTHPIHGAEILLATPGMPDIVPMVAYEHHLHYDGGGYPKQKRHRDLNIAGMITSIANNYDNLRRNRPGQNATSLANAINWMDRRFGTHFHPLLFKKFRALVKAQANEDI
ncbi:MAG: HD domain-containing protein [Deltaproteobacteria bacterium]|nr:HD domain-containing protein [Deltaproteobacteria bacterium]